MTLATLVLFAAFVSLGRWQWHRGVAKEAVWAEFDRDGAAQALGTRNPEELPRFAHVTLEGRYLPAHQFVLDNRSHQGRPGYEVLTPFVTDGGRRLLVNRGWLPFTGFRDQLPEVGFEAQPHATISGRLEDLPAPGLASGRAPPDDGASWPKLTSFPTHEELARALDLRVGERILLLDPQMPHGYLREWQPPGLDPSRHFSYAIQWWGFAVVLLVIYFGLNFRKVS
ncbi:MAG TPA: SURF1 family protein [Steroidobacteraceae bacterium]